jgi:hypothetical protein
MSFGPSYESGSETVESSSQLDIPDTRVWSLLTMYSAPLSIGEVDPRKLSRVAHSSHREVAGWNV